MGWKTTSSTPLEASVPSTEAARAVEEWAWRALENPGRWKRGGGGRIACPVQELDVVKAALDGHSAVACGQKGERKAWKGYEYSTFEK